MVRGPVAAGKVGAQRTFAHFDLHAGVALGNILDASDDLGHLGDVGAGARRSRRSDSAANSSSSLRFYQCEM